MPTIHPTGQPYPLNAVIDFGPLPRGDRGAEATVQVIRALIHSTDRTGWARQFAQEIGGDPLNKAAELAEAARVPRSVAAIFLWTKTHFKYRADPANAEATAHPDQIIMAARQPLAGIPYPGAIAGDCDDRAAFVAALTRALGYPSVLIIAGREAAGRFEHIYPGIVYAGRIVPLDSQECAQPGQERPAARRKVYAI